MSGFGDFEEDDALEEWPEMTEQDLMDLVSLKGMIDAVNDIPEPSLRKLRAKMLVRDLNGEADG